MNDLDLRQNIIDELEFTPGVDAAHIGVVVADGVVTLSGHVPSYAQKSRIEDAVRRVKGVHGIAEEIEVRVFGADEASDEDIAGRALQMLHWNSFVPRNAVQVQVQRGWITLTGQVEWQFQRQEACDAVRRLHGVTGVTNRISVAPRVSADDIKKRIDGALRRAAAVEAAHISVDVREGGKVTIHGKVHDWVERSAVERAAWSAPGVCEVEDQLSFG